MLKISIITPTLNAGRYLERAIHSVVEQQYANFEHIVVDGLSTDNTIDILRRHPHIKWVSERDHGQSHAMNKGFALSSGDIIVYLNADDYFHPGVFSDIASHIEAGAEMVIGKLEVRNNNGANWIQDPSTDYREVLRHWLGRYPINPLQYFYRRSLQEGLQFNEANHLAMDHEFLLQLFRRTTPLKLDRVFGVFDMVDGSKTAEGLKNPADYWSPATFAYVDSFLSELDAEEVLAFKNAQCRFFLGQRKRAAITGLQQLLDRLGGLGEIVIYGAGTQFGTIQALLKGKIARLVDRNPAIQGRLVQGYAVFSPSILKTLQTPAILVTALGYRDEITAMLASLTNAELIFLEDYLG